MKKKNVKHMVAQSIRSKGKPVAKHSLGSVLARLQQQVQQGASLPAQPADKAPTNRGDIIARALDTNQRREAMQTLEQMSS